MFSIHSSRLVETGSQLMAPLWRWLGVSVHLRVSATNWGGGGTRVEFLSTLFLGSTDSTMATFNSNPHLQWSPNDKVPLFLSFILCLQNSKCAYRVFVPTWCHHVLLHDISQQSVYQRSIYRESALFVCPDYLLFTLLSMYGKRQQVFYSRFAGCFTGSLKHPVFQGSTNFYCRPYGFFIPSSAQFAAALHSIQMQQMICKSADS